MTIALEVTDRVITTRKLDNIPRGTDGVVVGATRYGLAIVWKIRLHNSWWPYVTETYVPRAALVNVTKLTHKRWIEKGIHRYINPNHYKGTHRCPISPLPRVVGFHSLMWYPRCVLWLT